MIVTDGLARTAGRRSLSGSDLDDLSEFGVLSHGRSSRG